MLSLFTLPSETNNEVFWSNNSLDKPSPFFLNQDFFNNMNLENNYTVEEVSSTNLKVSLNFISTLVYTQDENNNVLFWLLKNYEYKNGTYLCNYEVDLWTSFMYFLNANSLNIQTLQTNFNITRSYINYQPHYLYLSYEIMNDIATNPINIEGDDINYVMINSPQHASSTYWTNYVNTAIKNNNEYLNVNKQSYFNVYGLIKQNPNASNIQISSTYGLVPLNWNSVESNQSYFMSWQDVVSNVGSELINLISLPFDAGQIETSIASTTYGNYADSTTLTNPTVMFNSLDWNTISFNPIWKTYGNYQTNFVLNPVPIPNQTNSWNYSILLLFNNSYYNLLSNNNYNQSYYDLFTIAQYNLWLIPYLKISVLNNNGVISWESSTLATFASLNTPINQFLNCYYSINAPEVNGLFSPNYNNVDYCYTVNKTTTSQTLKLSTPLTVSTNADATYLNSHRQILQTSRNALNLEIQNKHFEIGETAANIASKFMPSVSNLGAWLFHPGGQIQDITDDALKIKSDINNIQMMNDNYSISYGKAKQNELMFENQIAQGQGAINPLNQLFLCLQQPSFSKFCKIVDDVFFNGLFINKKISFDNLEWGSYFTPLQCDSDWKYFLSCNNISSNFTDEQFSIINQYFKKVRIWNQPPFSWSYSNYFYSYMNGLTNTNFYDGTNNWTNTSPSFNWESAML